ncbi:hypothetical protein [Bacillus alkalicellulosilyticus]|uniref:hypothetical protein n=1 Tax=Alkalihalobacterium alkalicellulosilyticum TaxID=1912214 RepID=UPI000997C046|nr:hypothetical protein [Bacillus alkalicellulosilyticus]
MKTATKTIVTDELQQRKIAHIVRQMSSDNPSIRALALQTLDEMVMKEVFQEREGNSRKGNVFSPSGNNQGVEEVKEKDQDLLQRMRLLQTDKKRKKRKVWLSL